MSTNRRRTERTVALALPTYAIAKNCLRGCVMRLIDFWQDFRGAWHKLTSHKHVGGLGFKDLMCFNADGDCFVTIIVCWC